MAKEIAKRENEVLVVDTDESNFGLYKQLVFCSPKISWNLWEARKRYRKK